MAFPQTMPTSRGHRRPLALVSTLILLLALALGRDAGAAPLLVGVAPDQIFASIIDFDIDPGPPLREISLAPGLPSADLLVIDDVTRAVMGAARVVFDPVYPFNLLVATPDGSQFVALFFDLDGSFPVLGTGLWTVQGVGLDPGLPGTSPLTDPGLLALADGFTAEFEVHSAERVTPFGFAATQYKFDLRTSSIPEPASLSLLGVGVFLGARSLRRRLTPRDRT